jgi:acetate kinase
VILHLLAQGWSQEKVQQLLYLQSGLLGVSNLSADMRTLRQSATPDAALAIRLFTYRVIREIGAMSANIGGIDILAFTGGIGEHDSQLRENVCHQLGFLGLDIDQDKNHSETGSRIARLHTDKSTVEIYLIPTDEGRVAAQQAVKLLA